jgi:hypothetical protein
MKKLVLLWMLLLAGCSSGSTVINEEPIRENETVESAENEQTNPVTVLEDFDSVEEWLIDRLFAQAENHYVDFRFQGQWVFGPSPHKVYFDNNHSIRVAPSNTRQGNISVIEDLELVGQSLSKVPHVALNMLDQVVISPQSINPSYINGQLSVSVDEMVSQLDQRGLFDLVMTYYIDFVNQELSNQSIIELPASNLSYKSQTNGLYAMSEAYWLQVMVDHNLLTSEEEQRFNEFLLDEYAIEVVGFYEARDFDASTLPPHQNPDIKMDHRIFENVISSFEQLRFIGRGTRYHERIVLPEWCMHPSQCTNEVDWTRAYPYDVFIFEADFSNNESIEFLMTTNVTQQEAEEKLSFLARIYGQMPPLMLKGLQALILIEGRGNVWGGPYHGYHTVLSNCGFCDLFEFEGLARLILHELAHATLDEGGFVPHHENLNAEVAPLGLVPLNRWLDEAERDAVYVTKYAENFPEIEDIAETINLYVAARYYSDRLGPVTADALRRFLPHRFALLDEVFDEFNR